MIGLWLIGHELRRTRLHAQRTQADAAKALGCTPAKINYLEGGRNQQHPDEVGTLLRLYGAEAADIERLASLAGRADQGTWWAPFGDALPNWFKTFVGLEGLARGAFVYDAITLSGQLQTSGYATALLEDNLRVSRAEAGIEEAVLNRLVGGPSVMRAQLAHLLELGERDNVTLQVMPTSVAVHDGLGGEFLLLDFAEARSIAYIEYRNGAIYVQDQQEVEVYNLVAERLTERALSDTDSATVIRDRIAAMT
jgi:transcriptional regulator with XRE-family HTH domain